MESVSLLCSPKAWFSSMSLSEKKDALTSVHNSLPLYSIPSGSKQCLEVGSNSEEDTQNRLSVPFATVKDVLSEKQAQNKWKKASHLLNDKKVIRAPDSNPKIRWVSSETSSSPHVVTTAKINPRRYVCDKQCIGWKTYNICAHCLATAEDNKELDGFLTWFVNSKGKDCNLTKAVYHDTYKHAGLKKPPCRKCGDAVHLSTDQKNDRLPLGDISNAEAPTTVIDSLNNVKCQSHFISSTQPSSQSAGCASVSQAANSYGSLRENSILSSKPSQQRATSLIDNQCVHSNKSVGAVGAVQMCSSVYNVGTLNISTPLTTCSSQQVVQSSSTTPLVSLLSAVVPQLCLSSVLQSLTPPNIPPGVVAGNTSKDFPQKPATVKSDQPFFSYCTD